MNELSRLQRVTANYEAHQGLRLVPVALPIAYSGITALADGALDGPARLAGFLGSLALAIGLGILIARWYERRYGVVRPTKEQKRATAIKSLAAMTIVGAAAVASFWLDQAVTLFGLALAAVLALYWRSTGGLRLVHVAATAAIVAASLLPLADVSDGTAWGTLFLTIAAAFVGVGVSDHRYLSGALPATPEQA